MEERHIEALKWVLPGVWFTIDGEQVCWGPGRRTGDVVCVDHLCGEIERALLARKSETTAGPINGMEWVIWAPCDYHDDTPFEVKLIGWGGEAEWESGLCPDKLTALLEATARLRESLDKPSTEVAR